MTHHNQVTFDAEQQCFVLSLSGFDPLRFSPRAEIDGTDVGALAWKPSGEDGVFQAANPAGDWTYRILHSAQGIGFSLECRLSARTEPVSGVVLKPLQIESIEVNHVLCHGRGMGQCDSYPVEATTSEAIKSIFYISLTRGEKTLQLSHPLIQGDLSGFSGRIEGNRVVGLTSATVIDPVCGEALRSETVTVASGKGHELMEGWAAIQIGDREPLSIPQKSGWNSWDYYRWTITEEEVLKNAEFIAADPILSQHVERIVIDDGWQYCYGEWEANSLFPSGMESLAKKINKMGFTAGLWIAPTLVEPHSRIAQLDPDMMAMGLSGLPCLAFSCMRRNTFLLDPTRPRVKQWWDQLFRRYAGYGFRYFKLDFLGATLDAPRFFAPVPKGEMMREILEPIRAAVGQESRILGCNYQFQGGRGLVDEARISADIHADWESVKMNVNSIAARYWAHGRLWINDPDFAVCRGEETSNDLDLHRLKPLLVFVEPQEKDPKHFFSSIIDLNRREAEVLLSLVIISGGALNLSDNLPRLNADGLRLARKAVCAEKGEAAIALDLFTAKYPAYWAQKLSSGLHRLLIINWGETRQEYSVNLDTLNFPKGNLTDFWSEQSLKVSGGHLSTVLEPHSCLLVEAKN